MNNRPLYLGSVLLKNSCMDAYVQLVYEYVHDETDDPFLKEVRFHLRFERIHPFGDGNGRTGRILINRGLMQSGLAPAVIPKEERATYLNLLADREAEGLAAMLRCLSTAEEERMRHFE